MNDERMMWLWWRQNVRIHGHLRHRYSVKVHQFMNDRDSKYVSIWIFGLVASLLSANIIKIKSR